MNATGPNGKANKSLKCLTNRHECNVNVIDCLDGSSEVGSTYLDGAVRSAGRDGVLMWIKGGVGKQLAEQKARATFYNELRSLLSGHAFSVLRFYRPPRLIISSRLTPEIKAGSLFFSN